jgi:hypothetical protein
MMNLEYRRSSRPACHPTLLRGCQPRPCRPRTSRALSCFARFRRPHLPPPSSVTAAECEPLWQTILGCLVFAALYGLVLVVL